MAQQKKNPDETAEQTFIRLAQARVTKTLKGIKVIGNLARYPHNSQQTNKIVTALREAVDKVEYQFGGEAEKPKPEEFSL